LSVGDTKESLLSSLFLHLLWSQS